MLKKRNASMKHITCHDTCTAQVSPLPAGCSSKFNVAYNIAKEECPFTKFKSKIILMKKNGSS